MSWRIYYADGSIFEHLQGPPEAAPKYGVLAILHRGVIEHGFDWYLFRGGRWVGCKADTSLVLQCMFNLRAIDAILAGESVPNEVFAPVLARAVADQAAK